MDEPEGLRALLRWRLILGRHADGPIPLAEAAGEGEAERSAERAAERDRALSFLYDREHASRGHQRGGSGSWDLSVPSWLGSVRSLFPREAASVLERDALVRYGLTDLVTDPEILRTLEPTLDLVGIIVALRSQLSPPVMVEARRVVREVVSALADELGRELSPALLGAPDPERGRPIRTFRNADWPRTIRRNLSRWDPAEQRILVDRIAYRHRQRARAAMRIVLAVDQSGSMADSLVHAAVTAAILAGLPAVTVHLVLWDDRVVDLTGKVDDPLEALLAAQLGGGTLLYPALRYCADLITVPERTVLAVISDLHVHDALAPSLELARELAAEGVRCLAFAALTRDGSDGAPTYDERLARDLAAAGWWVGAVTPRAFAREIGRLLG